MNNSAEPKPVYRALEPITKSEFDNILAVGTNIERRVAALRGAESIDDYDWLIGRFKLLLADDDVEVRSGALIGIGDVARLFRQADEKELKKLVRPLLKDQAVACEAEQALWDIYVFLSRERRKRKRERRKALQAQNSVIEH